MSVHWYDKAESDSITAIVKAGFRSFKFLRSTSQPPGPADNSPATAAPPSPAFPASRTRSDAYSKNSHGAQMPSDDHATKYLTRNVSDFIDGFEKAEALLKAPVHIDLANDDEDEDDARDRKQQTFTSGAREADPLHRTSTPAVRAPQSDLRSSPRLKGGLIRRSPHATVSEDSVIMNRRKTAFKAPSFTPINTLDATPSTRSLYVQDKTKAIRRPPIHTSSQAVAKAEVRSNDHATPDKRQKTEHPQEVGNSAASAINLDDSQKSNPIDDSEDELAFKTDTHPTRNPTEKVRQSRSAHEIRESPVSILSSRSGVTNRIHHPDRDSSPADEGGFTKGSAQQRRAEKDQTKSAQQRRAEKDNILDSPPAPDTPQADQRTSPYFGLTAPSAKTNGNASSKIQYTAPTPESPDVLQGGETGQARKRNGKPYGAMTSTALTALIAGDDSSTNITKPATASPKNAKNPENRFNLTEVVCTRLIDASVYTIEVDTAKAEISFHPADSILPDGPLFPARAIRQIANLEYSSDEPSLVSLKFRGMSDDRIYLRFRTPKTAYDFITLIQTTVTSLVPRGRKLVWMEDALKKYKLDCLRMQRRAQPQLAQFTDKHLTRHRETSSTQPNTGEKRTRMIDKLDGPSSTTKPLTVISGADRRLAVHTADLPGQPIRPRGHRESSQPRETAAPSLPPRRTTRSGDDQIHPGQNRTPSEQGAKVKFSQSGALGPPWKTDLVYPHPGRRAAVVGFEDLARLDDDEFLNDNLILFFMRYLETHMEKNNPELYKRMHFFNTYFYEALTKTPNGKKGLNYEAVSRWTKHINLFNRDFVVVPVNENLHWYVAIICNLPHFLGDNGDSGWPDTPASGDQPEEAEDEGDQPTAETQKSLADLSISDREAGPTQSKKKGPGRRNSVRRPLQKYEIQKPVVITLDSLGHGRSATCTQLKKYVAQEAKDKRGLDIDWTEIRGMTAKEIPTQNNFSDCGLYVCAYLEQFIADPYNFIRRILQRDEGAQQWPRRIRSEDLRSKLRELILEMHKRQEQESSSTEEPVIGNILTDKKDPSPTPEPLTKRTLTKEIIDSGRRRFNKLPDTRDDERDSSQTCLPVRRNPLAAASERLDAMEAVSDSQGGHDDEDDVIIDEEQSRTKVRSKPKSWPSGSNAAKQHQPSASAVLVKASPPSKHVQPLDVRGTESHSTPAKLAQKMRNGRQASSKKRRLTEDSKSPEKRRESRSSSRLTDELVGPQSYFAGIMSFASRASASPERLTAKPKREPPPSKNGTNVAMVPESASSSPEPEIVGERKRSPARQTAVAKKRKRNSGMKVKAPETAEELAKDEFNVFEDEAEVEVPETQQVESSQHTPRSGHQRKKSQRDAADEMLLR